MNRSEITLEFHKIKEMLADQARSEKVKEDLRNLQPILDEAECRRKMKETTAARELLDSFGEPPLPAMTGLSDALTLAQAGSMLLPDQLNTVLSFTVSSKRMAGYLRRAEASGSALAAYGRSLQDLTELREEIERCIRSDQVESRASNALQSIRRKLEVTETQIKEKLSAVMQAKKKYLADSYISQKNGHFVLPVKKEYRNEVSGTVVEISSKGTTLFIEPNSVAKAQNALAMLKIEEDCEVRQILYTLTALVIDLIPQIQINMDAMEILDGLFAKARLSAEMKACEVEIGTKRQIRICQGRHPLLPPEKCVPLNFQIDEGQKGVIITGPNTGGKTVAIKTVGLLSTMAQCGLHVPADKGTYIAMHDAYWCDIGDGQNISENLSTFSSHMTNIIHILSQATGDSLVLLDELGSGTDPAEGMGIAIAVLEELKERGCLFLVTTHYPEVKDYAESAGHVQTARMAFDRESLRPLYLLEMGKSGESCALYIAEKLGLPGKLLNRAHQEAYGRHSRPVATRPVAAETGPTPGHAIPPSAKTASLGPAMQPSAETVTLNQAMQPSAETASPYQEMQPLAETAPLRYAMPPSVEVKKPGVEDDSAPFKPQKSRLKRYVAPRSADESAKRFEMGDSVTVMPEKEIGIVYKPADDQGDVIVQVKEVKKRVNHKRLILKVPAAQLYPPDYDFSIIFDSVENRKARHNLDRKRSDMVIEYEEDY